jgi:hypothetical protein
MFNNKGLLWQLLTGKGLVGGIMSGIGSILWGIAVICLSEFLHFANSQPPVDVHPIHPPSRVQTAKERQFFREVFDVVGIIVLIGGVRKIVLVVKYREF